MRLIERLAKFQFEWADGWLEPNFSHYRWADQEKGLVTYLGDKIKFQNGFGAWQHYVYSCDYDPASDSILDVGGAPGRL